jgi:hypothetical protein
MLETLVNLAFAYLAIVMLTAIYLLTPKTKAL